MKLCLIGDSGSVHLRRWVAHFSKSAEVVVISDSPSEIAGIKVLTVFKKGAGLRNLLRIPRLRREVRNLAPDIVHGHYLTVGGLYASLSGGARIVGSAWGSDVYYGPQRSIMERRILRFVLKRCELVFAGTRDMGERVRRFGYNGPLSIFRWGVDPDLFKKGQSHGTPEFRIISIRPCDSIYNPIEVVLGFKQALPDIGSSYLYVFDFGDTADAIHKLVEGDPGLTARVRFLGKRPLGEMPAVYNSGDLAISVPNSDSAAASVLEAMACELPVLASNIANMREWIEDGTNGFLAEPKSAAISGVLRKAYAVRKRLPEMGRRAREKVLDDKMQGTFASNVLVAEKAYQELLQRVKP